MFQKVHNLLKLLLGLVNTCNIGKCDFGHIAGKLSRFGLAE